MVLIALGGHAPYVHIDTTEYTHAHIHCTTHICTSTTAHLHTCITHTHTHTRTHTHITHTHTHTHQLTTVISCSSIVGLNSWISSGLEGKYLCSMWDAICPSGLDTLLPLLLSSWSSKTPVEYLWIICGDSLPWWCVERTFSLESLLFFFSLPPVKGELCIRFLSLSGLLEYDEAFKGP